MKQLKNVSASVHQRLLTLSRQSGRPFNEWAQYYALERWLYRLSQSDHQKQFVLKGALMLLAWKMPFSRPTRDIDLLGHVPLRPFVAFLVMRMAWFLITNRSQQNGLPRMQTTKASEQNFAHFLAMRICRCRSTLVSVMSSHRKPQPSSILPFLVIPRQSFEPTIAKP
ncbi:MAG: hypothetical protein EBS96_10005 [Spartobacteria bacterium]|nr:hypothetical protein [Spartobacteria bacterium]